MTELSKVCSYLEQSLFIICFIRHFVQVSFYQSLYMYLTTTATRLDRLSWNLESAFLVQRRSDVCDRFALFSKWRSFCGSLSQLWSNPVTDCYAILNQCTWFKGGVTYLSQQFVFPPISIWRPFCGSFSSVGSNALTDSDDTWIL